MKTLHYIALLCYISLPFLAQSQTSQVHIAGSDFPVTFADTNLSAVTQQRMSIDLTFLFMFASSLEDLKGSEYETGVFQIRNSLPLFVGEDEHIFIVATNANPSIRIDKFLSDKYLKIFTWMDANSNTVQKARDFVTTLNSPDLLSKTTQELLNLHHFMPLTGIYENNPLSDTKIRAKIAEGPFLFNYPGFSALSFYFQEIVEVEAKIPLIFLPMVDKLDSSNWIAFPIGFYKGKWGFGNFPEPTGNVE